MPVRKVKGGYRVDGTSKVHKSKAAAERQQRAIKSSQARKGKSSHNSSHKPKRKRKRK